MAELDLERVEAQLADGWTPAFDQVKALVVEVRRLRSERETLRTILHRREHWTTTMDAFEGILGVPEPAGNAIGDTATVADAPKDDQTRVDTRSIRLTQTWPFIKERFVAGQGDPARSDAEADR